MSISVIGINHKTAPIAVREAFYFSQDKTSLFLQDILNSGVREAVLLSTCNRSELYFDSDSLAVARTWFHAQGRLPLSQTQTMIYTHHAKEAVSHLMRVACGLDSMVVGEPQILGQLKEAFSESCSIGAAGSLFQRLFQHVFSMAKNIRTVTQIGACPVSVASNAIHLAKQRCPNWENANILIVGAGETAELLLRYLSQGISGKVRLMNRSLLTAERLLDQRLPQKIDIEILPLSQLKEALTDAELIFTATGSAQPLINLSMLEFANQKQAKKRVIFDLAVPRDVDPSVDDHAHTQLYCIDDLKIQIEHHHQSRSHAAEKAEEMILQKSSDFIKELFSLETVSEAIRVCRGSIEELCERELFKARQQLYQGVAPDQVLDHFARAFLQKILHTPSLALRQAGADGRLDLLHFAKQLFTLSELDSREH